MARNRVILSYKYKKGVLADKQGVITDAKKSTEIHLLENGKMEDGTEFVVVKIFVK